jgi:hypothetical protein
VEDVNNANNPLTAQRTLLRRKGYDPIPVNGKRPIMDNWPTKINLRLEEIESWARFHPSAQSTGIICRTTPCLDLDITDPDIVRACLDIIQERFEERGYVLVRFGSNPKCCVPFRTDAPFKKIVQSFVSPNGSTDEKIEFLADGQQFVAFGIHPKTEKPYRWAHDRAPDKIAHEELPYIREGDARALVLELSAMIVDHFGWQLKGSANKPTNGGDSATDWDPLIADLKAGHELHDTGNRLLAKIAAFGKMGKDTAVDYVVDLAEQSNRDAARLKQFREEMQRSANGAWAKYAKPSKPQAEPDPRDYIVGDSEPTPDDGAPPHGERWIPNVSDWVQLLGDVLTEPMLVREVLTHSDGSIWIFVEGSQTGLRLEQVRPFFKSKTPEPPKSPLILPRAVPYDFPDPSTIPPRGKLFGNYYIRGCVGQTVAQPSRLKSTLTLTEAICMACGRNFLDKGTLDFSPLRVWYLNAEEDQHELDRRVAAIMQRFGITKEQLGNDRLHVQSVRNMGWKLAHLNAKGQAEINKPLLDAFIQQAKEQGIDVIWFDPQVSFHCVSEVIPEHMEMLFKDGFGAIAEQARCAVESVHHTRKPAPGQKDVTIDDSRGSSAQVGAIRYGRVLNFMSSKEADALGIPADERTKYLRVDNAKANYAPLHVINWLQVTIENLPNNTDAYPHGDTVATVSPWFQSTLEDAINPEQTILAQQLAQTGEYRHDTRAKNWFGYELGRILGLVIPRAQKDDPEGNRAKVKAIMEMLIRNKHIAVEARPDKDRKLRNYIVGPEADAKVVPLFPDRENDDDGIPEL